jgi:hypothetical protein
MSIDPPVLLSAEAVELLHAIVTGEFFSAIKHKICPPLLLLSKVPLKWFFLSVLFGSPFYDVQRVYILAINSDPTSISGLGAARGTAWLHLHRQFF